MAIDNDLLEQLSNSTYPKKVLYLLESDLEPIADITSLCDALAQNTQSLIIEIESGRAFSLSTDLNTARTNNIKKLTQTIFGNPYFISIELQRFSTLRVPDFFEFLDRIPKDSQLRYIAFGTYFKKSAVQKICEKISKVPNLLYLNILYEQPEAKKILFDILNPRIESLLESIYNHLHNISPNNNTNQSFETKFNETFTLTTVEFETQIMNEFIFTPITLDNSNEIFSFGSNVNDELKDTINIDQLNKALILLKILTIDPEFTTANCPNYFNFKSSCHYAKYFIRELNLYLHHIKQLLHADASKDLIFTHWLPTVNYLYSWLLKQVNISNDFKSLWKELVFNTLGIALYELGLSVINSEPAIEFDENANITEKEIMQLAHTWRVENCGLMFAGLYLNQSLNGQELKRYITEYFLERFEDLSCEELITHPLFIKEKKSLTEYIDSINLPGNQAPLSKLAKVPDSLNQVATYLCNKEHRDNLFILALEPIVDLYLKTLEGKQVCEERDKRKKRKFESTSTSEENKTELAKDINSPPYFTEANLQQSFHKKQSHDLGLDPNSLVKSTSEPNSSVDLDLELAPIDKKQKPDEDFSLDLEM